jgi:hypothetical protein
MPKNGNSCYELVAEFVNFTYHSGGRKTKSKHDKILELTGDQVRQRITPLVELGVSLDYWL